MDSWRRVTRSAGLAGAPSSGPVSYTHLINGWQLETASLGVYGNAYLRRALATQAQPGSGLPEDLTALLLAADSLGRPLDGAHRYVLHFDSGQLPPASALWSLAAYDGQGLPMANPLDRCV